MERMWKADETEKSKNNNQKSDFDTGCFDLCDILSIANHIDDCEFFYVVNGDQYKLWCDL